MNEAVALLATRAPRLRTAIRDAAKAGHAYVVLDGTLIAVDRVAADRPFYSGKHKKHGMNLQVIASPRGDILWVSGALPGSVHDKKAEWIWGALAELEARVCVDGLRCQANLGRQRATCSNRPRERSGDKPCWAPREPQEDSATAHHRRHAERFTRTGHIHLLFGCLTRPSGSLCRLKEPVLRAGHRGLPAYCRARGRWLC